MMRFLFQSFLDLLRLKGPSFFLLIVLIGLALSGCEGTHPATPPAPPAELPSALTFPENVGIDIDKIQSSETAEETLSTLVAEGGQFSRAITDGALNAKMINEILKNNLSLLSGLEIPISTTTTNFSVTTTVTRPEAFGGGSLNAAIKIDFSDYDLDGDGTREGCSGHTAKTPICFRLWWNDKRFMAGLFEEFPTEENAGKGEFRIAQGQDKETITGEDLLMAAVYDHSDPEKKSADLFGIGSSAGSGTALPENFTGHISLTQEGGDTTAKKQIRMSVRFSGERTEFSEFQYIGSWKEENDYWSGSTATAPSGDVIKDLSNACARISTGREAARSNCLDLGIDVEGIEFADLPEEGDVELPDDFPERPTF